MAGKARDKYGLRKKLKHQQVTNKELYSIAGGVPTQAFSSVVSAGSQGGGTYQNVQSADIYMNTYDIVDIDRLKFAVKEGAGDLLSNTDYGIEALYVSGDAYGMWFRIPAISAEGNNTQYIFYHGDIQMVHISLAEIVLNNDVRIEGFVDVDNIAEPSSPSGGDRRLFVDSGNSDHLSVKKSDGNVVDLEAGGSGFPNPANADLDMNDHNIEDINVLRINSDGAGSATELEIFATVAGGAINLKDDNDFFSIQVDGDSKFRIYDDEIQFRENITTDTANTCDIGSGSAWFGHGYMDNLTLMGSNSPALNVSTGTTTLGGQVSITGRVSATGGTGKLGAEGVSEVIGLSTKCWVYGGSSTPYELGTKGTLTSPYDESTTFPSSQSTLDDLFGDATGSIGVYEDTDGSTNYKVKFYYKGDDGWYQVSGTKV